MFFSNHVDLFDPPSVEPSHIAPWKPAPLPHDQWPPDYRAVYAWRLAELTRLRADPAMLASAKAYYRTRPGEFIMHWMDTYNPRKDATKWMPFVFFCKQADFVAFLDSLVRDGANGLVEKCRDAGATWICCAYSVHSWLFVQNDAIGWGSRKQDLVDKLGDPSSIFEKMRLIIKRLPDIWRPEGFNEKNHATFMKFINPENGSVITGEAGDNIGRGGRTRIYFKDESAHYERPEKIEAALGDNTNVQVDISSVNGPGNVFHRRRESGIDWRPGVVVDPGFVRVFVIDWTDHPEKTQEWYDRRKATAEREGMQHIFAQEVDRNYSAAIQNTILNADWVRAAIDAHLVVPCLRDAAMPDRWSAGLDVADEGGDRNALALRQWVILRDVAEWGERDPGISTRRTVARVRAHRGIAVQYDSIGVGAAVKAEYNRLVDDKVIDPVKLRFVPWNAGAAVVNPFDRVIDGDDESLFNKDYYQNFKAQAWWSIRSRFYKTWRAVTNGDIYKADELISLDSSMQLLAQLQKELVQPTSIPSSSLRTMVDKKPNGTKSPNLADAVVMAYFPAPEETGQAMTGHYQ